MMLYYSINIHTSTPAEPFWKIFQFRQKLSLWQLLNPQFSEKIYLRLTGRSLKILMRWGPSSGANIFKGNYEVKTETSRGAQVGRVHQ